MRVSGISDYLGGADNVKAISLIRGEQINYTGTVQDTDGSAMDITDFTISAVAEYYKADVTATSKTLTVNDFQSFSKSDMTLTVTKDDDPTTGQFTLTIPEDLADDADTADLDAATQVLVPVIYITYNDGGSPATIRKSRLLVVVRHSG